MNVERLTKMAELLDKVSAEHKPFNLGYWVHKADVLEDFELKETAHASGLSVDEVHDCGFVACAVGHACQDNWFKEQGLTATTSGCPSYGESTSWWAVSAFFEITKEDAEYLFDSLSYEGSNETRATEVAQRIRDFIKE